MMWSVLLHAVFLEECIVCIVKLLSCGHGVGLVTSEHEIC